VLESGDMLLLDVPAALTASLLQRLDQLIFSEAVTLADLSGELVPVGVHGPEAAAMLEQMLGCAPGLAGWPAYRHARAAFGDTPVVVARVDQLGVPGFRVYVAAGQAQALREALAGQGARAASEEAVTAARIEAGYPLFGADLTEEILPLEAGIEARAISFTKGCYVGQEVIIRVLHRGHGRVVRKLSGLLIDGEGAVAARAVVRTGEREVGFVTSAAVSPERGAIALGYVHRDFLAPGTELQIDGAGGPRRAVVTALPMRPVA
jgi:folate-binding protein YgfZ